MYKKLLCVLCVVFLFAAQAYGEDALTLGERNARVSFPLYFGFETEDVAGSEDIMATGWGFAVEYGIYEWLDLQLLFDPGFWGVVEGNAAPFSDMFVGAKIGVLGPEGLVSKDGWFRLASALGINIPVNGIMLAEEDDKVGLGTSLWGTALRVYADMLPHPYFYFNFFVEGVFYPAQRSNSAAYAGVGAVKHWLDLTGEIGPHFAVPIKDKGITLKGGAPVRVLYAPWMNAADADASDQWRLTVGGYFGVFFTKRSVELILGYNAPIRGKNVETMHRASLTVKFYRIGGDSE
jgi:hypothetical protein